MIGRIREGSLEQENFCLICHNEIMGNVQEHPLFVGGICNGKSCKVSIVIYLDCARYTLFFLCLLFQKELVQTSYAIGEDNIHVILILNY